MKLKFLLKMIHVGMFESVMLSRSEPDPVDDRSVNEPVGDHYIVFGQNSFENTSICVHAGRKQDSIFGAEKFGDLFFELLVNILSSADETDR